MMHFTSLLVFCLAAASACGVDFTDAIPANCRQVVLVESRDWSALKGTLRRFERTDAHARWQTLGESIEVVLGRHGMAWGAGLHSSVPENGPHKQEGDLRVPAGVFAAGPVFGRMQREELPWLHMPYQQLTSTTEAIDDPSSHYYNRIVERTQVAKPDWKSSEHMGTIPEYELCLVVAHNPQQRPGAGSCIFIHLWTKRDNTGTHGCTALHRSDLLDLLRWLDASKHPVLIQLPEIVAKGSLSGF
jgi:L,D-peptidoglycan transpeptidase YkuD (ErfK/YbiS/YcfS/YnhG family)